MEMMDISAVESKLSDVTVTPIPRSQVQNFYNYQQREQREQQPQIQISAIHHPHPTRSGGSGGSSTSRSSRGSDLYANRERDFLQQSTSADAANAALKYTQLLQAQLALLQQANTTAALAAGGTSITPSVSITPTSARNNSSSNHNNTNNSLNNALNYSINATSSSSSSSNAPINLATNGLGSSVTINPVTNNNTNLSIGLVGATSTSGSSNNLSFNNTSSGSSNSTNLKGNNFTQSQLKYPQSTSPVVLATQANIASTFASASNNLQPLSDSSLNNGVSKYAQLLSIIEEMGRDIRPTYTGSRTSTERLKRCIIHARVLVRECLMETERSARQ